ncbi:unnamed protein product [Soboliphyme baturini]|uniref:OB_NTP_bind domain-containing protein n=1 Tax=Soboliphyme baturini TaxID=241478 RepID=A0A183J699_9BILA|nr:unnamed protein product [Soboliphyme baturini]
MADQRYVKRRRSIDTVDKWNLWLHADDRGPRILVLSFAAIHLPHFVPPLQLSSGRSILLHGGRVAAENGYGIDHPFPSTLLA